MSPEFTPGIQPRNSPEFDGAGMNRGIDADHDLARLRLLRTLADLGEGFDVVVHGLVKSRPQIGGVIGVEADDP